MSSIYQNPILNPALNFSNPTLVAPSWFAVQTRSRHEKNVAYQLQMRGVTTFLPVVKEVHRWSDRRKTVELPLFAGYVFVQVSPGNEARVQVLRVDGAVRFVGPNCGGSPIPEEQIESIRTILSEAISWKAHPFLKVGQRVRVRGGALDGLEGIFQSHNGEDTLVLSVDAIQRSLSVRIKGYDVEVV